jgi:hypothetical protein
MAHVTEHVDYAGTVHTVEAINLGRSRYMVLVDGKQVAKTRKDVSRPRTSEWETEHLDGHLTWAPTLRGALTQTGRSIAALAANKAEAKTNPVTELALTTISVGGTPAFRLTFVHADGTRRMGAAVGHVGRATGRLRRFPGAVVTVDGEPVA